MLWKKQFWIDSTERAIKTGCQMLIGLSAGSALNLLTIDYPAMAGMVGGAVVLSYATSIISSEITKTPSASLVEGKTEGGL